MKCFRQLFRQPIKFIAGLILMTVAATIVCICVGQAVAAQYTAQILDEQFTTIALPKDDGWDWHKIPSYRIPYMDEDLQHWIDETAAERPDLVKTQTHNGLISAHIPALTPLNYTQGDYIADEFKALKNYWFYQPSPDGVPYSCAMLVITLEEVEDPVETELTAIKALDWHRQAFGTIDTYYFAYDEFETASIQTGYRIDLKGTVTDVVSLQEGYRDPTGMTARLTMTAKTKEELEALDLQPGETYLVYGMDYYDEDWALRGYLADERHDGPLLWPHEFESFDVSRLTYLTESQINRYRKSDSRLFNKINPIVASYKGALLRLGQIDQMNAVSLTLAAPVPELRYEVIRDEMTHEFQEFRVLTDVTYTDTNGTTVTMTEAEYTQKYTIPTITRLEGSVEDFLQSAEGAAWQQALDRDAVNNHAFAVIGVEKMMYLADFVQGESQIIQGRDFTREEVLAGSRVCVINEAVAVASGLEVGDTITLNFYQGDRGLPYQQFREDETGILTPSADFFFDTTPITETAEYTIVGFWRGRDTWVDVSENPYGFSPNTVFVPETSVETPMEHPDSVLFTNTILQNGKIEEFAELLVDAVPAHPELEFVYSELLYHDQGYSGIAVNFHNYDALARQVLTVGAAVYAVILLLFLILFPGTQRKAVATMESLGATRGKRFGHVMLSSFGVVAPATVLGGGLGVLLWQSVADALQASAESTVALQIDHSTLAVLALAQLVFAMALTAIIAAWVTTPRGLSKRRTK